MDLKKVQDALFTARWGIKAGKLDLAYEKVTEALEFLGSVSRGPDPDEPERPDDPAPDTDESFTVPRIVKIPGVSFKEQGKYRTPSGMFEGLVVHYTVGPRKASSAIGVVKYLASKGYGCMVMDEDGIIYIPENFDILRDTAFHAGVSSWEGKSGVSLTMAGMEICNWGKVDANSKPKAGITRTSGHDANIHKGEYEAYTPAQERSLINFVKWAKSVNPEFKISKLVGHDEVAPNRKSDPGASLSMTMPAFRKLFV